MKEVQMFNRVRRVLVVGAMILMICALLVVSHVSQAQSPDGRARRTSVTTPQQTPTPKATPTPKPAMVRPGSVILPDAPPEMADPVHAEIGENETLKINTDLVNLNVIRPSRSIRSS